jgi:hypothetical protein
MSPAVVALFHTPIGQGPLTSGLGGCRVACREPLCLLEPLAEGTILSSGWGGDVIRRG